MHSKALIEFNPEWSGGIRGGEKYTQKRALFEKIRSYNQQRYIICIQGIRRAGKSVLTHQLVEDLLQETPLRSPRHKLFFSFDAEDNSELLPTSELEDLLTIYFREILQIAPAEITEQTVIILDEIQNIRLWQAPLKKYYDLNPHIKFFITGSSSLFLQEGSESLAGRIVEFELPCLSFHEFLQFSSQETKYVPIKNLSDIGSDLPFFVSQNIIDEFEKFVLAGGFPDTAKQLAQGFSVADCQRFIRESIINKIILRDFKRYFDIKNTHADKRFFEICSNETGTFLEIKNIAREVGISEISVRKHLDIFLQTGLLTLLPRYDKKVRRVIKGSRKYYTSSPCLAASTCYVSTAADPSFFGHLVETYAHQALRNLTSVMYVERSRAQEEIDFYLPKDNVIIECKYSKKIDSRDFAYFSRRARELKCLKFVLSKDSWGDESLRALPVWRL